MIWRREFPEVRYLLGSGSWKFWERGGGSCDKREYEVGHWGDNFVSVWKEQPWVKKGRRIEKLEGGSKGVGGQVGEKPIQKSIPQKLLT